MYSISGRKSFNSTIICFENKLSFLMIFYLLTIFAYHRAYN